MSATCTVTIDRGHGRVSHYSPCGRRVEDGHTKCSMHEKVDARRAAKDRKWNEEYARGKALQDEAKLLTEMLGVEVRASYSWQRSEYDGGFILPGDFVRALAEERS